jgi:uncharacterized DUF497 family protein
MFMDISFDADKDAANLAKHKLPLSFDEDVLTNKHGEVEDQRRDYGEERMKAFSQINTMRGTVAHIINVHRVKETEMQRWLKKSG